MRYPYRYKKGESCIRIVASPEICCQIYSICREIYGADGIDLNSKGIFVGHWYVQFQTPFENWDQEAKKIMRVWRKRHNKRLQDDGAPFNGAIESP